MGLGCAGPVAKIGAGGYYRSRIVGAGRQGQGSTVPLAIREMALFGRGRPVMTLLATETLQVVGVR